MDAPQQSAPPRAANGGARWHVQPGWEHLVSPRSDLSGLLNAGQASIVKDGSHRTVYRVDLPQTAVYVKHYRCAGLLRRGRHLLRASSARREWRKVQQLIGRDLPTALPVAFGEEESAGLVGDSYLVTRAIDPSMTLDEAMATGPLKGNSTEAVRLQQQSVRKLAQLAAALHQAGVAPDDFHGGNILVQIEQSDSENADQNLPGVHLHLIDVPGIRIGRKSLSWREARRSLVMLTSGFMHRTSAVQRWRFWREYLRCIRPQPPVNAKSEAAVVYSQAQAYACKLLRGRDARALRDNRDFRRIRTRDAKAHAVREMSPAQLEALLSDPASLVNKFQHVPQKLSSGSLVVQAELDIAGQGRAVAYKRMRPTRGIDKLLNLLFRRVVRSKAIKNLRLGHALLHRGIPTARPVFCYSGRREEYLATEWIAGGENLHLFGWRIAELPVAERDALAMQAANALGQTIGRMHWWKIRHRDLKGCNVMFAVSEAALSKHDSSQPQVTAHIVDLDGVRIHRRLSYRLQVRDVARLAVSASIHTCVSAEVRQAFLDAYLKTIRPNKLDRARFADDIDVEAKKIIQGMRKRGAAVA